MEPLPPRQNTAPKDGYGPRGYPDCYYTSRVLNSTFRYVKFVKKLRALEEEQRRGAANSLKELNDKQYSDFFIRCDRRSLIKNVARRVDLCMASYEEDLKEKKKRLVALLEAEEEMNIRKFVEEAQAGVEALWQDKKDRLAYLLAKRQKEHEEKYKDTPLSKCVHVTACIHKWRAKEAQEIQRYQMKEKQARKMAEREIDQMWHEVAMKESEALAARMELDTIERLRRDHACKENSDFQIELRRQQREKEREVLKAESLRMRAEFEAYARKEDEDAVKRAEMRKELAAERDQMLKERQETVAKKQAEVKLINDTWDSLADMGLAEQKRHEEMLKQKERDLDECNKKMAMYKKGLNAMAAADKALLEQEAQRVQDKMDLKRCEFAKKLRKSTKDVRAAIVEQMKENAETRASKELHKHDDDGYYKQVFNQMSQLVAHKEMTEAQARKLYKNQLLEQMEYNKLLKERAKQEELEQRKKCQLAADEYQQEINRMVCRPFLSDEIHPFMQQMAKGLRMKEKCPCSKPTYCADPKPAPKKAAKKTV
ncbi:cilia- and flagella-associated protein 53-like [Trichoplusia ni]|uniref:Cilia- and flagella-associated protein 53-like n=1 Tax=Trichoplusia ni TaxID=7111 RepID=A0A7E5VS36_TRINI|nr:cilia- and flagella-associated protein 53-like [Trichoplusia ni]